MNHEQMQAWLALEGWGLYIDNAIKIEILIRGDDGVWLWRTSGDEEPRKSILEWGHRRDEVTAIKTSSRPSCFAAAVRLIQEQGL